MAELNEQATLNNARVQVLCEYQRLTAQICMLSETAKLIQADIKLVDMEKIKECVIEATKGLSALNSELIIVSSTIKNNRKVVN